EWSGGRDSRLVLLADAADTGSLDPESESLVAEYVATQMVMARNSVVLIMALRAGRDGRRRFVAVCARARTSVVSPKRAMIRRRSVGRAASTPASIFCQILASRSVGTPLPASRRQVAQAIKCVSTDPVSDRSALPAW